MKSTSNNWRSIKWIVISFAFFLLSCSKSYDFSGSYSITSGDKCEVEPGDNSLITISPQSNEGDQLYTARLSSKMSGFPLESKPSKVSDNGSLVFNFFQEGKSGFFSSKPSIDMKMKVVEKDSNHILVESWLVQVSLPAVTSMSGNFDFVNDAEMKIAGKTAPNELATKKGKRGLCLVKDRI